MFDVEVADLAPPPGLEVLVVADTPASDAPRERSNHAPRVGWGSGEVARLMNERQVFALFGVAP